MPHKVVLFSISFRLLSPAKEIGKAVPKYSSSLLSWLQGHDLAISPRSTPSHAARLIHKLAETRGISLSLEKNTTNPEVIIATICLNEDLIGVPKCVIEGSTSSLIILNHFFRQNKCCGGSLENCGKSSKCGFLCCDNSCTFSRPAVVECKEYHLDHVFSDCSAAEEIEAVKDSNLMRNINPRISPTDLLSNLPYDILLRIVANLSAGDLRSLQSTSRWFRAITRYYVPGLNVELYPHQRAGLDRMQRMEGAYGRRCMMPLLEPIQVEDTNPISNSLLKLFADLFDGSVYIHDHIPTVAAMRGGILADEPGLGKTVTGIALVLKTLDQRSKPPEFEKELEIEITRPSNGNSKRSKKSAVASHPDTVRVHYYEEVTLGGRAIKHKSVPARRTRILESQDYVAPTNIGSERINRTIKLMHSPRMETRHNSLMRSRAAETERINVLLSKCTLVICPKPLVEHWVSQVKKHSSGKLRVLAVRKYYELPSEIELALDYDVVVLSFTVISWINERMSTGIPSLFRVRFVRVFYDEGHEVGGRSEVDLAFTHFCMIKAERRWILTGTPTPSNPYSDVRFLRALLVFIREPTYGMDSETWVKLIQKPYGQYRRESLDRLRGLLRRIMIRFEKKDITSIPRCTVKDVFLEFSENSAKSYNELVSVATRNLLLCDWFSGTHSQSLLNERNVKLCHLLVDNIRQACVFGGGFIRMDVSIEDLAKALDRLYATRNRGHGALQLIATDDVELIPKSSERAGVKVGSKMYYGMLAEIATCFLQGGMCHNCTEQASVAYLTPCGHLVCANCILADRSKCPVEVCGTKYELDSKGIPHELIEIQPSMVLGEWQPEYEATSPKMEYLVNKLKNTKINETSIDGMVVSKRKKVIVYSQFDLNLMRVAIDIKNVPELRNCYNELYVNSQDLSHDRNVDKFINSELTQFRNDDEKFILLLGKKYGSVGLDLSFVEEIYLLEPFWDAALEKQVISRAHRIGAKAPIHVERIIMRGSIEEDSMMHGASLREDDISELQSVREVGKEIANRRGRDTLLRLVPVKPQNDEAVELSPTTHAARRRFPLLEYYKTSKQSAEQLGKKRPGPSSATAVKRDVRRRNF